MFGCNDAGTVMVLSSEDLKKATKCFSSESIVGEGGFGKVCSVIQTLLLKFFQMYVYIMFFYGQLL